MKRFIRTEDGKIIDINNLDLNTQLNNEEYYDIHLRKFELIKIVKEADTIEELIEVGDVVGIFNGNIEKVNKTDFLDIRQEYQFYTNESGYYWTDSDITELYTKQGRNYVLVAEKIDGEWRVI